MNLLFDFTVDKATHTIHVTRDFDADLDLVWDAWTKSEILDLWSAPKPWHVETKEMDFREGGRWLYAMVSPENAKHWSLVEYLEIKPKSSFTSKNSFSDENGNSNTTGFSSSLTATSFKTDGEKTTVKIVKKMADLAQLEQFIARGFKEGTTAAMKSLDEYLARLTTTEKI